MVHVQRTFTVDKQAAAVVDYLADFGNAEQWDPGTQTCTRIDDGPVEVGATWRNVSKILGSTTELTYRLEEFTPSRIVFVGKNKTATSRDQIQVTPTPSGSAEVRYDADVTMHGLAKLSAPLIKIAMERLANGTQDGIKRAIDSL